MKRLRKYHPLIVCIIIILLSSCSSTKKSFVVDKNNPPDQNASILFQNSYTFLLDKHSENYFFIKKYNNVNIEKYFRGSGILIVPEGNNIITFDVSYFDYDRKNYYFKNVELQYDFEPSKKYRVNSKIDFAYYKSKNFRMGYEYNIELYIQLYDITIENIQPVLLEEWKLSRLWYPTDDFQYR